MQFDKKTILIVTLSILVIVFGYFTFKSNAVLGDWHLSERKVDSLSVVNKKLQQVIYDRDANSVKIILVIDSLKKANDLLERKKIPIIKIISKYENYKSSNHNASADTMRSIFSESGIK